MNLSQKNTILITGGGSGLGRGLAEAFQQLGNSVIISGRRKDLLEKVAAAKPGMAYEVVDVQDAAGLPSFSASMIEKYPALKVVVHMAGLMKAEDLNEGPDRGGRDHCD